MAASQSQVSLIFHDISSADERERDSDFLPQLMSFLDWAEKNDLTVSTLYSAMLEAGKQLRKGCGENSKHDLFAVLVKILCT